MTPGQLVFLVAVGLVGGTVNASAGSFLCFPALLGVGLPPLSGNVTNTVGLPSVYLGGTIGYRHEFGGEAARARALTVTALMGIGAGCLLLLLTPAGPLAKLAPFLVLGACMLPAAQPRVAVWLVGVIARTSPSSARAGCIWECSSARPTAPTSAPRGHEVSGPQSDSTPNVCCIRNADQG